MIDPHTWALADEEQARSLGLPDREHGYGLILGIDTDTERPITLAGDRAVVAALDEHEGDVPRWLEHAWLVADDWPSDSPLAWRPWSPTA